MWIIHLLLWHKGCGLYKAQQNRVDISKWIYRYEKKTRWRWRYLSITQCIISSAEWLNVRWTDISNFFFSKPNIHFIKESKIFSFQKTIKKLHRRHFEQRPEYFWRSDYFISRIANGTKNWRRGLDFLGPKPGVYSVNGIRDICEWKF